MTETQTRDQPTDSSYRSKNIQKQSRFRKALADRMVQALDEMERSHTTSIWQSPWMQVGRPCNGVSHHVYKGINSILTRFAMLDNHWEDPRFLSFLQISDPQSIYHPKSRWHLRRGSKGVAVAWWHCVDSMTGQILTTDAKISAARLNGTDTWRPWYSYVYHASMIDGIPEWDPHLAATPPASPTAAIDLADAMHVPVSWDTPCQAFYAPSEDAIHLPPLRTFKSNEAASATLLHELVHASGHSSRLDRWGTDGPASFGSPGYAAEELTAEMGSAMLTEELLPTGCDDRQFDNAAAYIADWRQAITSDPDCLVKAIRQADMAADYMLRLLNEHEVDHQIDAILQPEHPQPAVRPALLTEGA